MLRLSIMFGLLMCVSAGLWADEPQPAPIHVQKGDWPWWRGPSRNGIAIGETFPLKWDDNTSIRWKAAIPGKGHGSPIIIGNQVVLLTATNHPDQQWVLSLDRDTGKELWRTKVHEGGFITKQNEKSTHANSTPGFDGERIFVNCLNSDAIYTTALDLAGKQLWQTKINDYVLHQGFSSSPIPYGPLVLVSADTKGGKGVLCGLNRATGKMVWSHSRPALPNYPSPIVLNTAGKEQMFLIGCDKVTSLDPLSGSMNWEMDGATTECVTSTVTDGKHIYTSGGYPKNHLACVTADGSNKVVWELPLRVYVPSMVLKDGYMYAMLDAGVATCLKADTGEEKWKQRVGGTFSSSLVLAGDAIYATDEAGKSTIFRANPEKYEQLGENQLGNICFATPAFSSGRIFHRVAQADGDQRQEWLYCIESQLK